MPHGVVSERSVVFATPDIRFALAMIHGAGDEIRVGYFVDTKTHEEEMYIAELQPDKLKILKSPGYIYEISANGFYYDPVLSHIELIKDTETGVVRMTRIENVFSELKKYSISFIPYGNIPE